MVSLLLGASIFIQIKETKAYFGNIQTSHYVLIATIYFLTFIYIILLKHLKNLIRLAYVQLLADTFFISAIIYTTGGIESIFSFLYILTIINGSIILYRKGGMVIASSSSILYGLLLDLHYYNIIHPLGIRLNYPAEYQNTYIFFIIVVNISAFYLVAFLSSYPSEQARRSKVELRAKQDDIINLEALNERIIQSITSGLITLDDQNRIILFNPAAEEIFGIKAHKAIGARAVDIIPFFNDYLMSGSKNSDQSTIKLPIFIDLPYSRQSNKKIFLRFSVSQLSLPEKNQKGMIVTFQDMTEIKKIEEEMKKVEGLALIGELAAGIAHEIRNPMASISGSIEVMKEGLEKDDVNNRLMDIVLREINRLNHLVNDFLLYARPKQTNLKKFDLEQIVIDALELFGNSKKWAEKIQVETNIQKNITLETDPEQLKQVLWNLFLNANEAMPSGGLLRINAEIPEREYLYDSDPEMVKISIKDDGAGFNEDILANIFIPFFTTKEGGSGLGLAIVKRIMEGLKGRVYGKNHSEGGAEVTILLPINISIIEKD